MLRRGRVMLRRGRDMLRRGRAMLPRGRAMLRRGRDTLRRGRDTRRQLVLTSATERAKNVHPQAVQSAICVEHHEFYVKVLMFTIQ